MFVLYIIIAIMTALVVFYFGAFVGFGLGVRYQIEQDDETRMRDASEKIVGKILDSVVMVTVEKDVDTFYLYRIDDGSFLCQGKTFQELNKELLERFPGKTFRIDRERCKELGLL